MVDDVVVVVVVVVIGAVVDVFAVLVVDSERRPSSIMNSVVVVVRGTNFSSSISFSLLLVIPNISKMSFMILFVLSSLFVASSSAISVGSSFSSSFSSQTTFVIFLLTFLGIFSTMCSHSSCGTISQSSVCWGSQTNSCFSLQTSDWTFLQSLMGISLQRSSSTNSSWNLVISWQTSVGLVTQDPSTVRVSPSTDSFSQIFSSLFLQIVSV